MACCIALALMISVVRTVWFRVVRRQAPPRVGFAPPARRPAPASALAPAAPSTSTRAWSEGPIHNAEVDPGERGAPPPAPARVSVGVSVGVVVLSAVIGAGLYSELLAALVHTGVVTVAGDRAGWQVRELALVGGSVLAALVAVMARLHRCAPPHRRRRLALALTGAGTAWSLLSIVDMHLTGLVPEALVDPLTDVTLHGPGFLALTTGLGALLAGERWLNSLSLLTTRGSS